MYFTFYILLLYTSVLLLIPYIRCQSSRSCPNNRPIIGILSQEYYSVDHQSYIAASYVKFLESAGARVVPIRINQDNNYYRDIFNSTNGLLFPGGGQDLITSGYAKAGKQLWDLAMEENQKEGHYYPIWGTCLGFELLSVLAGNQTNKLIPCNSSDVAMNLNFNAVNPSDTKIFRNADSRIIDILKTENVTVNYHVKCLTQENFDNLSLNAFFNVVTTNIDATYHNITYISTIEAKHYPIYGVMWHPEKNQFEWGLNAAHKNVPHDSNAILIGQYMANFFVNEARNNTHHFADLQKESDALIYNYEPTYSGKKSSTFEQIYLFSSAPQNPWCVSYTKILFITLSALTLR